eukprot:TRINITY_DN256_c0_g1_i4.p2 TRINITY_DN256_c0_g1~~TRINITY_DN256_c0_g1_i4.p2  ORF type:complete len:466 (-),score=122.43 TRINITY_DN256_c0_g1_i4:876-2273(-)
MLTYTSTTDCVGIVVASGGGGGSGGQSFGPGGAGGAGPSPGGTSFGPGMNRGANPAIGRGGRGRAVATHDIHGNPIQFNGPPCDRCGEKVIGKVTSTGGKNFHPECFYCIHCQRIFKEGETFVEHQGEMYCEKDYTDMFAPRCSCCEAIITENAINVMGKAFHPDHFVCTGCGMKLKGKIYKEHDGDAYCDQCIKARLVEIDAEIHLCAKCKKPIYGEYILIKGQRMHPEHYTCDMCGKEFKGGQDCHEYQDKLYCKQDYTKLTKGVCNACRKPIVGRSITAMGRVWHPDHFVCAHCHRPFGKSTFREHEGKPYCEMHYRQFFADVCSKCNLPAVGKVIKWGGKSWHPEHFVCQGCEKALGDKFHNWDDKPMCERCYKKLPKQVRKKIERRYKYEQKKQDVRDKDEQEEVGDKQVVQDAREAERQRKAAEERDRRQKEASEQVRTKKAEKADKRAQERAAGRKFG